LDGNDNPSSGKPTNQATNDSLQNNASEPPADSNITSFEKNISPRAIAKTNPPSSLALESEQRSIQKLTSPS